jgi:hypothetical protein
MKIMLFGSGILGLLGVLRRGFLSSNKGPIVAGAGNLYGTSQQGEAYGDGTVFK